MKKCISMLLAALMLLTAISAGAEASYKIGVCQLVQHAALDDATAGFHDAVTELFGDQVEIIEQNGSGDISNCISIINSFIAEDVDLILANATHALQAAYAGTIDIPILGTSVTDYGSALDLSALTGATGINVSGTSDLAPLDQQAMLIHDMFPEAKTVGLLYCTSETNSTYQVGTIEGYLTELGYACEFFGFTDTNDVFSVAQIASQSCDVLFVPTDNTIAACGETIRNVVETEGTPIVGGDEGICTACGVATICINYYDLGYATGKMAYEILVNGADVASMPVEYAPGISCVYNSELCELLNVAAPEGYAPIGG